MNAFRKSLRWTLPISLLALGLVLAIVAIPALFAQDPPQPQPMQGQQMQHGMMAGGQMSDQMSDQMKARHEEMQKRMAEHQEAMQEHMARMDDLMAKMNQATGQAKVDAMAAVLNEMWTQRKGMMDHMGRMGGQGMMHGHGCMMSPPNDNDSANPPQNR